MNEQQLDNAIRNLNRDLMPERELWPDIADRLPARAAVKTPLGYWASAAAAVLMGVIGWQLTILPTSAQRSAAMPTAELMLLQVYEQQKAQQLSQVAAVAEGFDNWQQQLQIWDQAIAQVRQALQFYPDEPQLLAQLQNLYQQQLSFIQQATLQQPLTIS
ncbi:hypothetical protein [Rheinheimera maricola]|uniref:Anti-sigma factor n=1 Tax=Rheinheimera maricola TaxID=2793282 RepID=A0ABS7X5L5_9GAMM|nr:hypothetical protein [Rheinheimera maricola]MBZ9610469.1 hypothetical protein [Rheinheimera maricola]